MTTKPIHYYVNKLIAEVNALGLHFDHVVYGRAVALFKELKISQKQHDALILFHAREVADLFNPKGKGLRFRLLMALHFLGLSELRLNIVGLALRLINKIKGV